MSITVAASEVERNFARYHDCALSEPVKVIGQDGEAVYIVSAEAYHRMKQALQEALAAAYLSDDELAAIETAEIPAEHRYAGGD